MSLYQQPGSPYWYIYLRDESGTRIRQSTGTTNEDEAQLIHDEIARNIRLAKFGLARPIGEEGPPPPDTTFSAFKEKYINFLSTQFEPKTAEAGKSAFAAFQSFLESQKRLDPLLTAISIGDVEAWKTWLLSTPRRLQNGKRGKPLAPATLDLYFRTLRAAWNRAVNWEDALVNPFAGAENPRLDDDEGQ